MHVNNRLTWLRFRSRIIGPPANDELDRLASSHDAALAKLLNSFMTRLCQIPDHRFPLWSNLLHQIANMLEPILSSLFHGDQTTFK